MRGIYDGIKVYHCIDGAEYARVADWPNRFMQDRFREVVNEFRPEIVHFHNYLSLGDDLVDMASDVGAKVVYTLHDYGLICPNNLLLKTDGRLCDKQDGGYFQDCCPAGFRISGGRVPYVSRHLPSLDRWRMFANQHPGLFMRPVLKVSVGLAEGIMGDPEKTDVEAKKAFYLRQTRKIFTGVDLFIAPSEYLRQRYIACGLPEKKILFLRNGMRHFERSPRRSEGRGVKFGYIGALHAHKGVEVLLNAFRGLGARASLHIYGSAFGSPISENHWRRISGETSQGVVFHGPYDNSRIGEILAGFDVVVVPSVWFENSPLTIQEAFIAGVPVVTSNQGGMAELVRDGVDGLHFRLGDAENLRSQMERLIEDPTLLDDLRSNIPSVPGIEGQVAVVRRLYGEVVSE